MSTDAVRAAPPAEVEGLTSKAAWWAGARAGLCLPPDTPREAVADALDAARAALSEPAPGVGVPDGWTDADADAARLALELECLLTDKDVPMPALSRWWDSAHEALELHSARFRTAIAAQWEAKPPGVERELFEGE